PPFGRASWLLRFGPMQSQFPPAAVVRQTLIRHCYDERRSCFRSAPSLSVVAMTTPQFMPGILRWGEFREQFNEGLDAGNCAGERRRGSTFAEASDPGGSRNGSTEMRS